MCTKLEALTVAPAPMNISSAFRLFCSGCNLAIKDVGPGQKSDPFFVVSGRPPGAKGNVTIYRSEVIKQNLNPDWASFVINLEDVGGIDVPIHIAVWDWDSGF